MFAADTVVLTTHTAREEKLKPGRKSNLLGRGRIAGPIPLLLLLLWPGSLPAGEPPSLQRSPTFQHQAVVLGTRASFIVPALGDAPLTFQWRLAATDLEGCTNRNLVFTNAQPSHEGDYTVVVSNAYGTLITDPVRLYVVPPATNLVKGNYTNAASLRLPYFYLLPADYGPQRRYPLAVVMHGSPGDESNLPTFFDTYPSTRVFASCGQQATDPVILVWPSRRVGENTWSDSYLQLVLGLIDALIANFSIDTNRIHIAGGSEGVHAAWDLAGLRPSFFASMAFGAGWQGAKPAGSIKDLPSWAWCAADDGAGQLDNTRTLVETLRVAGGSPIYTEYDTGGHVDGIFMGMRTPTVVDWILAQRRGTPCTNEPRLWITQPTGAPTFVTGASVMGLAGRAAALGQTVTNLTCKNFANGRSGVVAGTTVWSASGVPLQPNKTNNVRVTATTTSWSAGYGGSTTFNAILKVSQLPLKATLTRQGVDGLLNWTGGGPPYSVQRATALDSADWAEFLPAATPPVVVPMQGAPGFYRVVGR